MKKKKRKRRARVRRRRRGPIQLLLPLQMPLFNVAFLARPPEVVVEERAVERAALGEQVALFG